ncbi:ATP-dependent DNA helicase [Shewanella sp. 202IG2-18]|uniref:ATP-dependent DNA helicase n=1 Tax=Parashewanella hymeniacidonis TaxID=2807618 RepID=UPI00196167A1|nr:ATP-dependent DNA helicase [Parashewanella hymeniacidonis]MBM7072709.1 ATP-dependent DNA helicase [Parashewanella hymeniacidonis]
MSNRYINQVEHFFSAGGRLDKSLKQYRFRAGQKQMALAIAETINAKTTVVVEAGTGIGKSFAYLAPALIKKQKVIISTATKNLQQQLFDKDIPFIVGLTHPTARIAILKGLSNYLCIRNLERELSTVSSLSESVVSDLLKVQQWAQITKDGDLNQINGVSESSSSLNLVRTKQGDCTGKKCVFYSQCYSRKAKLSASESDILVINHHLVFNENFLAREGDDEYKIDADVLVFDEAHSLADALGQLGGTFISESLIRRSIQQVTELFKSEIGDSPPFLKAIEALYIALDYFKQWLKHHNISKLTINHLLSQRDSASYFWGIINACTDIINQGDVLVGRNQQFDTYIVELKELKEKMEALATTSDVRFVQYLKFENDRFEFDAILHDVKHELAKYINDKTATIYTSATLSINGKLDYFTEPLGLRKANSFVIESPFDYQRQAMLYIPRAILPRDENIRQQAFQKLCEKLIKVNKGKTFILCTSHKAVRTIGAALTRSLHYPVLVQGQTGRQALLKKYRILGDAVLIGTYSFWEGIDIKGNQLSNIIFDKLPFPSPDDFFVQSKSEYISQQGGDSFSNNILPSAIQKLKQGVGRLIRHENDSGLITIFDERLVNKAYGQYFLSSIPELRRTRSFTKAKEFLESL